MYCRTCRYDLRGLDAVTCPECGAAFDPRDPETYFKTRHERPASFWFALVCLLGCAGPFIELGLIHLALVAARVSLGRWPQRFGMDDPKDLTGIGAAAYYLASLGFFLVPMSLAFVLVGVTMYAVRGHARRGVMFIVVAAVSWAAAIVIARMDPARAMVWFMD